MAETNNTTHTLKTSTFQLPLIDATITIQHFTENNVIDTFLKTLTLNEVKTLNITYEHLGSSFDLERSILFKKWASDTGIQP
jgi:hypothetical protein